MKVHMKKFVLRVLFFLLPALFVLVGIETFIRSLPNGYKYKDGWMWENGHRVSTLILGNSHGYYGLSPSFMGDSVFNLCFVSQRLEHDFFLLNRYAKVLTALKRVVLVVDNSNLFDMPMEVDESGRVTYYQLYMGYRAHSMLSKYGFELANMPYIKQKLQSYMQYGAVQCDSLGWGNNYTVDKRSPVDFKYENVRQHRFVNWTYTYRNRDYMDSVAAWCQQRNIQLILVQTPVCRDYTKKADAWQLQLVNAMTDSCCVQYGARKLDYSCDSRFQDLDFYDSDHLSDRGARRFSVILKDTLATKK